MNRPRHILQATLLAALAAGTTSYARVGGGHSFSGSRGGGGGGGGGGDLIFLLIQLMFQFPLLGLAVLIAVSVFYVYARKTGLSLPDSYSSETWAGSNYAPVPTDRLPIDASIERLAHYDHNFSEVSFTDYVYALYARVHEARGAGRAGDFSSYLSEAAIASLPPGPPAIRQVSGIVIGASNILSVSDPDAAPEVTIRVHFEANYTETDSTGRETAYYVIEQWSFTRRRDVVSPPPEQITALHCPRCGGGLEKKPDGSCAYCGVKITAGDFAWFVTSIELQEREERGPLLTSDVPEVGTDFPTVFQPDLAAAKERFKQANPDFDGPRTEERFRHIFTELQEAWSSLNWERARPYETDSIFAMHQYWISEYRRQRLRNVLEDVKITGTELVKIGADAFYDSLTLRIFAQMKDYTQDSAGKILCGSARSPRQFSEYWTFVRRRGVTENRKANENCPSCGAALKVNMAGVCEYCGGKIVSGNFDWVLGRIEQDESYRG